MERGINMQGEIRIPVPVVPKNCYECDWSRAICRTNTFWCELVRSDNADYLLGVERPPFCPIQVLSESVMRREAIQEGGK